VTPLAEGLVSVVGALACVVRVAAGSPVGYELLPSLFLGAFFAATAAPYAGRVPTGIT
jgi:hypothetical protein